MENEDKLLTARQFCEKYPWPSLGALRNMIWKANNGKNGFGSAFKYVGRRVLINPKVFWDLVECMQNVKRNK